MENLDNLSQKEIEELYLIKDKEDDIDFFEQYLHEILCKIRIYNISDSLYCIISELDEHIENKITSINSKIIKSNWTTICKEFDLSEEFFRKNKDYLNWSALPYYRLSIEFIKDFKDKIDVVALAKSYNDNEIYIYEKVKYNI